jgi:hypothetical protein
MMHCGKHDIIFPESGSCWCCDQEKSKTKVQPKAATSAKPSDVPTVVATGGK